MSASLIQTLRAGPPPPRVVLLPDAMFFTRAISIVAGSTAAEVNSQVELALETLSPFPPAQLYHGYYWVPGADRALVYAAYRRRFTNEQLTAWENAELVIPSFVALLTAEHENGSTFVIPSDEGVTAVFWDHSPVPQRVAFHPVPLDAGESGRSDVERQLTRHAPSSRVVTLRTPPMAAPGSSEREFAFRSDAVMARLPAADAAALDVRDKADLAALRAARRRDLLMWRGFVGLLALLLLLGLGELALVGGRIWLKREQAQANAQRPVVEKIMTAQSLTTRINELSTKRLLPFEMIGIVTEKRPETVTFLRTSTVGLYGLTIEAYTNSPAAVSAYQAALRATPAIESAEVRDQRTRDNQMTFTVAVTFRSEALKPASSTP